MKFSVDKCDNYTVFSLLDETLNSMLAPNLKSELVLLSNEGVRNLILDLSQVKFVDSSGLSAILTGNRIWKDLGLFILAGATSPSVKKLIEISRLDSILTIIPTVSEAIDYTMLEELARELNEEQ